MSASNAIVFVILLVLDTGNMQIAFPKNDEIQLPSFNDAALHLGLRTLANLKETNAVVSPVNIYSCLWLLYSGARGDTKTELRNVLGSVGKDPFLPMISGVYAANALFLAPNITVKQNYLMSTKQSLFTVDFQQGEPTREIINEWVSKQTKGTIPLFLDTPLDSSSLAVVISALYFNASWLNAFPESKLGDFQVSESSTVQVPLMTLNAFLPVIHGSSFKAVGLPYQNKDFTFYILLPEASGVRALKNMIRHLTPDVISKTVDSMREENLIVTIPRFLMDVRTDLRPILRSLGINKIFDPVNADFGDLFEQTNGTKFFISEVFQTVHLKVDEGGTEGSAATSAVLTKSGRSVFRVTRPFAFMLRHSSGHVIFLGSVTSPKL